MTSPPPSETFSWSQLTTSTTAPDQVRVFIQLPNAHRFMVPLSQNSTVEELHEKALQRAQRHGFSLDSSLINTFLQTTKAPVISLHSEDELITVLDLTDDNTFNLVGNVWQAPVNENSTVVTLPNRLKRSFSGIIRGESTEDIREEVVYLRWVTLEDALSHSRLSDIKTDHAAVLQTATLDDLYAIAQDKFAGVTGSSSQTLPHTVKLYLKESILEAQGNLSTLQDLKLTGTRSKPLEIFVDFRPTTVSTRIAVLTQDTDVDKLWGFATTKRGVATLMTSLKILMHDLAESDGTLASFLEVLYEVTHFPPLVLAFQCLHSDKLEEADWYQLRLVAHACHILCLQIVPIWICPSSETALESSRQLVAWLYSQQSSLALNKAKGVTVVRKIKVMPKTETQTVAPVLLPHLHTVTLAIKPEHNSEVFKKDVVIALDQENTELAERIGKAFHTNYSASHRVDFTLNLDQVWDELQLHRRLLLPQPAEFDLLLTTTTVAGRLRMVGPLQLGALLANQLPVITLSSGGYVSVYDQEDVECSQRRYFTYNVIERKDIQKSGNPGQYLTQKLEPIIADRKKNKTWSVDSWTDWNTTPDFGAPDEALVVCIDTSFSMNTSMGSGWVSADATGSEPSRLVECIEFFKNLALRVSALRLSTYLGLVTFSAKSQVSVKQELTPVHLNFEDQVDKLKPQSQTAIYDGIDKAREMLRTLRQTHPSVKARIILLTDGDDNHSSRNSCLVAKDLHAEDIVLDSVVIGTTSTWDLFKISKATGGYAFAPKTQQAFFQIFLLETVVDIRTRPDIVKVSAFPSDWQGFMPKGADMATPFEFPPIRSHPNQGDYFVALADADKYLLKRKPVAGAPSVHSMSTRSTSTGLTGTTVSAGGTARIVLAEIKEAINHKHEYMDIYVSEKNMGFWKIAMQGPPSSAYSEGVFLLYLEIGPDYPTKPPAARFITSVLHPNVTKHGRICHPIFDREWNGQTKIYEVLQHIWGIFMSLEARDTVDPLSTMKYFTDPEQGRKDVQAYVARFATKSRAVIRNEFIGDDVSEVASSVGGDWDMASVTTAKSSESRATVAASTPPSYRSNHSSERRPGSTISSRLAALRGQAPAPAPPLMGGGSTTGAPSEAGNGRKPGSRRSSFFAKLKK